MNDDKMWQDLLALTGSPERARAVFTTVQASRKPGGLTEQQRRLYVYLATNKPIVSQRQLARDAGFDHPQKMLSALGALVAKGYVIARTK